MPCCSSSISGSVPAMSTLSLSAEPTSGAWTEVTGAGRGVTAASAAVSGTGTAASVKPAASRCMDETDDHSQQNTLRSDDLLQWLMDCNMVTAVAAAMPVLQALKLGHLEVLPRHGVGPWESGRHLQAVAPRSLHFPVPRSRPYGRFSLHTHCCSGQVCLRKLCQGEQVRLGAFHLCCTGRHWRVARQAKICCLFCQLDGIQLPGLVGLALLALLLGRLRWLSSASVRRCLNLSNEL